MVSHDVWSLWWNKVSTYNPRRKDLCCNNITSHAVAKGPTKSVQVDRHNTHNATRGNFTIASLRRLTRKADVEGKVQHAGSLDARANDERESSTYTIDEVSDVVDGCNELDETVDASGEQTLAVSDADHLEDSRGEVIQGVGSGQLVE